MKPVSFARIVLGFIAAALWLPGLLYILASSPAEEFAARPPLLFTVPLTVFFAVPAFLFLKKRPSFLLCVSAGAAIGGIGALLFLLTTHLEAALNWAPALIGCGLVSSVLFWLVAIWRNRDNSNAV